MVKEICEYCHSEYIWNWTEAFDKYGFNDGEGFVETDQIFDVIKEAGYEVKVERWGLHNIVITSIKKGGKEFVPIYNPDIQYDYDRPRDYLPEDIVELLDSKFPPTDC